VDESRHTSHRWPYFLPDGKHLLYLAANHLDPRGPATEIYWTSVDGGETRLVTQSSGNATYSSDRILYSKGRVLLAQAFEPGGNFAPSVNPTNISMWRSRPMAGSWL
jgi:hypothetical protein